VNAEGSLHYDAAGVALRGEISEANRQSWLEIFGKRFNFDRIFLDFDGSIIYNPSLDIRAHFDSPSVGRINLLVAGRYLDPEINFESEQYAAATQGEILAMLVLGRRDSRNAADQNAIAQQTQDVIAGILAGFGTTMARRQLDALPLPFIPRLIVEPGIGTEYRYGLGGTLTAVPRLYIEGTYGTVTAYTGAIYTDTSGQRPADFHALAEYTLSQHWSVSANFGTSGRLGTDLYYNFSP
jgi:hypothetical protein